MLNKSRRWTNQDAKQIKTLNKSRRWTNQDAEQIKTLNKAKAKVDK